MQAYSTASRPNTALLSNLSNKVNLVLVQRTFIFPLLLSMLFRLYCLKMRLQQRDVIDYDSQKILDLLREIYQASLRNLHENLDLIKNQTQKDDGPGGSDAGDDDDGNLWMIVSLLFFKFDFTNPAFSKAIQKTPLSEDNMPLLPQFAPLPLFFFFFFEDNTLNSVSQALKDC
ncbi:hypothetical protein BCR42DRAFT_397442 [Absidia repens]|uniref:Uncharacterized protein n=1 Tax=Absidia repens TaxID=90262 RepID=A0A1X2I187_9FUNG|nr:hypothetical protein BCR42DRAFT_397442 [Absidia repens]